MAPTIVADRESEVTSAGRRLDSSRPEAQRGRARTSVAAALVSILVRTHPELRAERDGGHGQGRCQMTYEMPCRTLGDIDALKASSERSSPIASASDRLIDRNWRYWR
jgi:hypothetical protein